MAKIVDYRGYTITSIPLQPVGTHEWKPDIKDFHRTGRRRRHAVLYGRHHTYHGRGCGSSWD